MALRNSVNFITFWLNFYNFVSTTCGIKNFITFWWYHPWCVLLIELCVLGYSSNCMTWVKKTSRRKIIKEGTRVTLLNLLSHSTFSFFESFAWPGNTTGLNALEMSDTCIIIVVIITYIIIFPLLLQSNLWRHFGLQKNVKSNGIQFNKTKGLPTITEWNVVPHMEDAEKGSSSQVHRHTGKKKN